MKCDEIHSLSAFAPYYAEQLLRTLSAVKPEAE